MTYNVEIPNITNIGTAENLSDLVKILRDGDCIKRMSVPTLCKIVDSLDKEGDYIGTVSADSRFKFVITKTDE